ncbi:polysaccharide deacetylase family protein [Streptomyces sp. NPDC059215]|uniref:polysaccharide deacetylase family protein n=1 Tax=Streptomyces sp. NPDC059215 TaxID=3346772 RepID=UPI0036A8432B
MLTAPSSMSRTSSSGLSARRALLGTRVDQRGRGPQVRHSLGFPSLPVSARCHRSGLDPVNFSAIVRPWEDRHSEANILKARIRLAIFAALAVMTAAVVAIAVASSLETLSPRAVRNQAAAGPGKPPGGIDCREAKCIALTFDGNPGNPTDALLDLLARYRASSTFFLEGRKIGEHPDVVRRIATEGHELGNHTWTHPRLTEVFDAVSGTPFLVGPPPDRGAETR